MMESAIETPPWLETLLARPVAVFGGGASGGAARDLLAGMGASVDIFDQRKGDPAFRDFTPSVARRYGSVVYSPGFALSHPWFQVASDAGCELLPESDLGASLWRGPIIAITGTNGKTTLTEFLEKAFGSAGIEAYSGGNIGTPLSRLLADKLNCEAIAIAEVSSFQAAKARRLHADYVLWTNFDEDHLDWHASLEEYFDSKYNLVRLMRGDVFLFGRSVLDQARLSGLELDASGLVEDDDDVASLGIKGTAFESLPERCTYLMARALWLRMGLSESELIEAAHSFKKSPHRMELVVSHNGISYWDDSKATNFHAVLGGVARFGEPVVWIGGGKCKGGDIGRFAARLAPSVSSAHLIGETSARLAERLREQGVDTRVYDSLEEAVAGARSVATVGDHILLSPGFASLDMFESYSQRGEAFLRAINSLEQI